MHFEAPDCSPPLLTALCTCTASAGHVLVMQHLVVCGVNVDRSPPPLHHPHTLTRLSLCFPLTISLSLFLCCVLIFIWVLVFEGVPVCAREKVIVDAFVSVCVCVTVFVSLPLCSTVSVL